MESKNVKKAASLVAKYSKKTAIEKAKKENAEVLEIVRKKLARAKLKTPEIYVNDFCRRLVKNRLKKIAEALPDEGYSMGSMITVKFGKLAVTDDRRENYAKSCKFRPTHGAVLLTLSANELKNIHVIAGLVTFIYPGKNGKVKKCFWYEGKGQKQYWKLTKVEGFLCGGYHAKTKHEAVEGFKRNEKNRIEREKQEKIRANYPKLFEKALRKQYSFADSLSAGNCEAGTRAFILRCGLDSSRKYRGKFLLETAKEKSSSSFYYVERMIKSKIRMQ